MKINQNLYAVIPKIPANIVKDGDKSEDILKRYLIELFVEKDIGIIDKIHLSLIDKRDKSEKFYICIILFRRWFESEFVEEFQKNMNNRTAKIFYNNNENFFYVYPQKKLKDNSIFQDKKNVNIMKEKEKEKKQEEVKPKEIQNNTSNLQSQSQSQINLVQFTFNDLVSALLIQKNMIQSLQQDLVFYFTTLQNNIEIFRSQNDYNISNLRQEQLQLFNNLIYPNQVYNNNNFQYHYDYDYNNNYGNMTDIYNRNYLINSYEQPILDTYQPIESMQRKRNRRRHKNIFQENNKEQNDYIENLRSQIKL